MQTDFSEGLLSPKIYTVTEISRLIKSLLEENIGQVWVDGEISNLRNHSSGHSYFTLKDESSQLRAVMFRRQKSSLKFRPEDGLRVIAMGSVTVYEPRGDYQLIVEYMEPRGVGALQLAFEQLKARLQEEGLFDEKRKRPIPLLPQHIGVVTSPTGAAIRDILRIIERRFANVHVLINPVHVQGEGAANEIANAIDELNQLGGLDVIIVGRGGGSLEDLWAFNEEVVARAIHRSRIPVISAVGHEIDFTIADFVADLRAPTPSAAAEMVVKNKEDLEDTVRNLDRRLTTTLKNLLREKRGELELIRSRRGLADPFRRTAEEQQRMDDLTERAVRAVKLSHDAMLASLSHLGKSVLLLNPITRLERARSRVEELRTMTAQLTIHRVEILKERAHAIFASLDALSPVSILGRGYAICRSLPSLKVIKEAKVLKEGDRVSVKVSRGEITCQVEGIADEGER